MKTNRQKKIIAQIRRDSLTSAAFTRFSMRECAQMDIEDIRGMFGNFAANFWLAVRAGTMGGVQ